MRAFWDIALHSFVGVDRRFVGADCLHHQDGLFITMMMEAVLTSETSAYSNETTRRYTQEGCHLHTRRRENLKSDYSHCVAKN
jgi:hypothetical protein